ncbi:MAG: ribose 5-phosphate isomerase B [Candidatus Atribacteria bacterium]|nr:ribose 5-phosphate isomerase B [Candidatus Atribacteria bacterium]
MKHEDSQGSIRIIDNVVSGLYSSTTSNQTTNSQTNTNDKVLRVAIGSDHGGYEAKEKLKIFLQELGYRVTDVGTYDTNSVDYPDFALKVALKVKSGDCERGIMIDGAGIGSSMVCNKVRGIRAALCYDLKTAVNSREHNNANVLTLGGPLHPIEELYEIVKVWLETKFAGGRHWKRINKMMDIEKKYL